MTNANEFDVTAETGPVPNMDHTLYARWAAAVTVTFAAMGGSAPDPAASVVYGVPCVYGELPATARAIAVIEIVEDGEQIALESAAQLDVRWVARHGRKGPLLLDALAQVALPQDGDGYVWVACEHAQVQGLRGHFIDAGVPKQHLHVASYWKHGAAEHHEHHDE